MPITVPQLVDDIEHARGRFVALFGRIDDRTAKAAIGENRWSPLEYLEHLVRAEEATLWRMFKAVEDARAGGETVVSESPHEPIEAIVDRTWGARAEAPPFSVPTLGASPTYWSVRMSRNASLVRAFADFVDGSELDSVAYVHPISGPFTMKQGLEFIRFHLERHRNQLVEAGIGKA